MENTEMKKIIDRQRTFFQTGTTLDVSFRIAALKRLQHMIRRHEKEIEAALLLDLKKSSFESYMCETGLVLDEIHYMLRHIRSFAKEQDVRTPLAQFCSRSYRKPSPYGVTLIVSPWNYPILLTLDPLIDAIAAGNTVILKPSAYSPACSDLLAKLIHRYFPTKYLTVITGGRSENTALLEQHFDYIFFTGSKTVGREVMRQASSHLTPVTLELGGKSPCLVDESADLALAARRIVFGKFLNCGQTCVAPDYLLAERSILPELVEELKSAYLAMYPGGAESPDWGKLIDAAAFDRAERFLKGQEIVWRGGTPDREKRRFPFTLIFPAPNAAAMEEELFCPILPILPFDSAAGAKEEILKRPTPLALYVFTRDARTAEEFSALPFGGGCINDTVSHLLPEGLPFGGTGESGLGSYHGYRGFFELSHFKSVLSRGGFELNMKYPPYGSDKTLRRFWK